MSVSKNRAFYANLLAQLMPISLHKMIYFCTVVYLKFGAFVYTI